MKKLTFQIIILMIVAGLFIGSYEFSKYLTVNPISHSKLTIFATIIIGLWIILDFLPIFPKKNNK